MEAWWSESVRTAFAGRPVILAGAVAAAWGGHVEQLRAAGVDDIMVYAPEGPGAGPQPDVPTVVLDPPDGLGMMERLRFGNRMLDGPPRHVVEALDRFDPERVGQSTGSFLCSTPAIAGRPFIGWRRPEWVALEDKVAIDRVWDRAGVARQPVEIVAVGDAADAARRVDRGAGTVWAADAREGFHGGASGTFWVTDEQSRRRAMEALGPICDTVRVMPFVDGIACSIHGIVLPDGIAVLRPVEMITLREGHDFVYAGFATFWDPPEEIRTQMRDAARRVGKLLAREVAFRGSFTIDGVVDGEGFWPTELNPRFGAGLWLLAGGPTGVPILLLNSLLVEGRAIGRSAAELEAELLDAADRTRGGATHRFGVDAPPVENAPLTLDGEAWRPSSDSERVDATVLSGRGFMRCTFGEDTPVGPPVAARAASFWSHAAEAYGVDGALVAPPDPFA